MKKGLVILICLTILITTLVGPAISADEVPALFINDQMLTFDVPPMIENGRILVPLRAIFEQMGAAVSWDDVTQTASAVKGDITVVVTIGSVSPTINGVVKPIDVPAKIVNGRTLAPLRFVAEAFGNFVKWDAENNVAYISATPFTRNDMVNKKADDIISKIITPGMSNLQKELAIHDYLIDNVMYSPTYLKNRTIGPDDATEYGVLINGFGVCQGFSRATKLLLNKVGIECMTVSGPLNDGGLHVWNIVNIDGAYYHLDVTHDLPGSDTSNSNVYRHYYFNLTDTEMSQSRSWAMGVYPTCTKEFAFYDVLHPGRTVNGVRSLLLSFVYLDGKYIYFEENYNTIYRIKFEQNAKKEMIKKINGFNFKICADGDWLYYTYFDTNSLKQLIKKIKTDGSQDTLLTISYANEGTGDFYIKDGWLYFELTNSTVKTNISN